MALPYLVVTTGYPSAGKSELSEYLTVEHKFIRLSTDYLRDSLYNKDYGKLQEDPLFRSKEDMVWDLINYAKIKYLERGLDIVIDSTAPSNKLRYNLLDTKISANSALRSDKYLAWIVADRNIINKRNKVCDKPKNINTVWDKFWENPKKISEFYKLLKYKNNTPEERECMFKNLDKRFGKKVLIPVSKHYKNSKE